VPGKGIWFPDGCLTCAFSGDGRTLWVGARSGWIHRWDLRHEPPAYHSWQAHKRTVSTLAASPDGRWLYSLADDGLRKWPVDNPVADKPAAEYREGPNTGGLAASPRGDYVVRCGPGQVEWLNQETLRPCRQPFARGADRAAFSPDGRLLALSGQGLLLLVDTATGAVVEQLSDPGTGTAHEGWIGQVAFNNTGSLLLSACGSDADRRVRLWDVANGRLLLSLPAGGTYTLDAAFRPDGRGLAVSADRQVHLYDLGGMEEVETSAVREQPLRRLAVLPGERLACLVERDPHTDGAWQAEVALWDQASHRWRESWPVPGLWLRIGQPLLAAHPRGRAIVCSMPNRCLSFVSLKGKNRESKVIPAGRVEGLAEAMAFAPDGARVWAVVDDKKVHSWSWPEGKLLSRWEHWDPLSGLETLNCLAVGRRGVLAGGRNGSFHLLHGEDGKHQQSWSGPGGAVRCVASSRDGTLALVGTQTGRIRIIRLPSGETVADLAEHRASVEMAAFSPDGHWLATGSRDGATRLWLRKGMAFRWFLSLQTASGPVTALAFGRDSRLYVLEGRSRGMRVWRLDQLRQRLEKMGLTDPPGT
jgi:WD40 repeat protein